MVRRGLAWYVAWESMRSVVCGVWGVVCGVWCVTCDVWCVVCVSITSTIEASTRRFCDPLGPSANHSRPSSIFRWMDGWTDGMSCETGKRERRRREEEDGWTA